MLVASIVAPAGKAAPQTGTSAGEPAASGGTPADDQPSFESVLAHEEHIPAPPTLAGTSGAAPQPAKPDEAKKPASGAAPLVPVPAPILAALLAAVAVPVAAAPTKAADTATGSLGAAQATGSASVSLVPVDWGDGDERDARAPRRGQHSGDFANSINPEKPDPRQLIGALEALVPSQANRTDRTDRSDRSDRTDPTGRLAVADQPATNTVPYPAPHSGAPGLAAASGGAVPSLPAEATQSQAGAVASADPTPRGRASQSTPAVSHGSEALLHAVTTAAPLTARAVAPVPRPLLAEGAAKTAGEARNSADPARTAGDPRMSVGAGAEFTAPLAILPDTSDPKPSRDRPTSNQGLAPITDKPITNLDPTNLARPALGGGFAATTSTVGQGVGQWTSRANGDDHVAPAPPFPMHNQAASFGLLEARPITRLPDPTDVAAPQQVIGATSGLSRSRSFHPASAGGPSANQTSPPEALQSQPVHASGTQGQSPTAASQIPHFPNGGAQPRPQIVAARPAPTEPSGVSPRPAMAGPDHHSAASAPSRGSDGSSVQSWANGAGTLPAAQHAQPAADAARSAPASQTGAVHQPIAQGIVVRQASLQMVGAVASFKVVLHPRSLGEVTVQVTRVQEGLQVTIAPQQLTTQTLLNKHLPDLLGTLRTGQDLPVQAQVVAPPTPAPTPLGTPEAAAAGQSGLNFSANGGGQSSLGGQGGGEQQAWAGTMNDLFREPARIRLPASPVARATAARMVGNPRIDVHA